MGQRVAKVWPCRFSEERLHFEDQIATKDSDAIRVIQQSRKAFLYFLAIFFGDQT
jgi:hypothetical protein